MDPGKIIHTFQSKKGNTVMFRYPAKDDFAPVWSYACALADEDTFVEINARPTEQEEREWFDEMIGKIEKNQAIYIHVCIGETLVGSARVLRGRYRHQHVGTVGISLAPHVRGEGIGKILLESLIAEARKAKFRLLTLSCYEPNVAAHALYEKLGFITSGITPGAVLYKGEYIGEVHYYLPL